MSDNPQDPYDAILQALASGQPVETYQSMEEEDNQENRLEEIIESVVEDGDFGHIQQLFDNFTDKISAVFEQNDINVSMQRIREVFDLDDSVPNHQIYEIINTKKMELYLVNDHLHSKLVEEKKSFKTPNEYNSFIRRNNNINIKAKNFTTFMRNHARIEMAAKSIISQFDILLNSASFSDITTIEEVEEYVYEKNYPYQYHEELLKFIVDNRFNKIGDGQIVQNIPGTTTWQFYTFNDQIGDVSNLITLFNGYKYTTDREFWNLHCDPKYVDKFTKFLLNVEIPEFRTIKYSRFAYQFSNGVYISNHIQLPNNYFTGNSNFRVVDIVDKKGKFYKKGTVEYEIQRSLTYTADMSNLEFDDSEYENWRDIETPYLDQILNYQRFSSEVKEWIYILLGRLLYPVALFDNWELAIFLYGVAGCGKSRLISTISNIVGQTHVGTIDATSQDNFVLGENRSKRLIVVDEIKKGFPIGAATFQSMVSGSFISQTRKFGHQITDTWKQQLFLSSNDTLPFVSEQSNSVTRRIFLLLFKYRYIQDPNNPDGDRLEENLKTEEAKILRKINEAYLEAAVKYKGQSIQRHLPEYFKDALRVYQTLNNYLWSIFKKLSDPTDEAYSFEVTNNEEDYITFRDFKDACRDKNIRLNIYTKEESFREMVELERHIIKEVEGEPIRILGIKKI